MRAGIVCLSSGVLGEPFAKHEKILAEKRLREVFDLNFKYMDNALKGEEFLRNHPEKRAEDLKQAFLDPEVDVIWSALGGEDTFRTLPFLMNDEFRQIVQQNPKPFLGFSDTTNNHLMLYKMGLKTFYAPAILSDVAELGPEIFPFTVEWLKRLLAQESEPIVVGPSPVWYKSRASFGEDQLGIAREEEPETHGFEFLYGEGEITGELLGGCLDSLYEMLAGGRFQDQLEIFAKYPIFPAKSEWRNKIIFLETSEEQPTPAKLKIILQTLAEKQIFNVVKGLIVGKPQDEVYYDEYKEIYQNLAQKYALPTVFNLNFGHTTPRMVLPYGRKMTLDFTNHKISLPEGLAGERKK